MDGLNLIWGLAAIVAGIFVCVYGNALFRLVLAVIGFMIGFWLIMALPVPNEALRIVLAIVVGGIGAAVLYRLFRLSLHIAGALLGAVLVMVVLAVLGLNGSNYGILTWILVLAGAGVLGVFGNRLGNGIIPLATSLVGAAAVVLGLSRIYQGVVGASSNDPVQVMANGFALVLFVAIAAISFLAQLQITSLKRRLVR